MATSPLWSLGKPARLAAPVVSGEVIGLVGAVVAISGAAVALALLPGRTPTAAQQVQRERLEVAAVAAGPTGLVEAA